MVQQDSGDPRKGKGEASRAEVRLPWRPESLGVSGQGFQESGPQGSVTYPSGAVMSRVGEAWSTLETTSSGWQPQTGFWSAQPEVRAQCSPRQSEGCRPREAKRQSLPLTQLWPDRGPWRLPGSGGGSRELPGLSPWGQRTKSSNGWARPAGHCPRPPTRRPLGPIG